MPKFNVSVHCVEYYLTKEIEAKDKYKAEEKYQKILENGDVEVNESEWSEMKIEEVKM